MTKQVVSVCSRHFDVAKKDVWMKPFNRAKRFSCIGDDRCDRSGVSQQLLEDFPRFRVVIYGYDRNAFQFSLQVLCKKRRCFFGLWFCGGLQSGLAWRG